MIYTVTLNPAIDLIVDSELHIGELNRARSEDYYIGGKGILVSEIVRELGEETMATGFLAGFTGDFLISELNRKKIPHHFIDAEGVTRVNVKVLSMETPMTELNLTGIRVNERRMRELMNYIEENVGKEDMIVISGISAEGISMDDFRELCRVSSECAGKLVVDTSLGQIMAVLEYHPWLVRPSIFELYDLSAPHKGYVEDMTEIGKKLCQYGAQNVLVRDAAKGTVLISEENVYFGESPDIDPVSSIGAMDAMVAGFVTGYVKSNEYRSALQWAIAAAAATSASYDLASGKDIEDMLKEVFVVSQEAR